MTETRCTALSIFILLLLAGCDTPPQATIIPLPPEASADLATSTPPSPFPMSVEDALGNRVIVETKPERIVSLAPGHTEILYALGLDGQVVGVIQHSDCPPQVAEKHQVGGFPVPDVTQIVDLKPDLVLATPDHMVEVVPALQDQGITVFVARPETIFEVLTTILTIGHITGHDEEAEEIAADMQSRIDLVQEAIVNSPRPRVFWEMDPTLLTLGPGTLVHDLIVTAGGENIAADANVPWLQLSLETLVERDPEVVVLADFINGVRAETTSVRPGWQEITAVREGRIVEVKDMAIVSRPGPRIVDGVEFLGRALYPGLFD